MKTDIAYAKINSFANMIKKSQDSKDKDRAIAVIKNSIKLLDISNN